MKVLCVFGKYQYGDPSRGIGTEYAAFIPALRRLGHEVVHFDSWDRSCFKDFRELNKALLETVNREMPDVLLSVQMHYEIWLETLQIIQNRDNVATICWTTDDSWKYNEFSRFVGKYYHAMTTTYPSVITKYLRDGISNILLTQWAANIETLKEPIPANSCCYQISFVGAAYGNRKMRVSELRSKGIEIFCFGHGWPAGSINFDEIPQVMRKSVISLNFANSKGQNQIKARTFEVPGAGGFLLTEYSPGLEKFYVIGKEIVVFNGVKDLVERAKYYLAHPEERDAIARAGFERTKKEHTYDIRMEEVLNFALRARDEWLKSKPRQKIISFDEAYRRHKISLQLRVLRMILVWLCTLIWGRRRGLRAARRLVFEISWHLFGQKTFTASGLPGRMFPKLL